MHLFLEGPVRTGKSTAIRQCIAPYIAQFGGFSCQRLWQNGTPCGYRLTSATESALDAPYDPAASGIFLYHTDVSARLDKKTKKDLSVFETIAIDLLDQSQKKQFILLDEIGGIDLLVPRFREKLYEVLAGPIPCIGVLKSLEKAQHIGKSTHSGAQAADYNQQLRRDLLETFSAQIISFTPENRAEAYYLINSIFSTMRIQ